MNVKVKAFWKLFYIVLFIIIGSFFCFPEQAPASRPEINDIMITSDAENLLLYAGLTNCFKAEMETSILAGVPTIFTIQMRVYQTRPYVWDKKIASVDIKRTIKYDNLSKTFNIVTDGNPNPMTFNDFESAQKAMADLSGIPVMPIASLVKGGNYYLRLKVKIDKVRLPLYMEYLFLFVSFWDFETVWYKQSFSF